MILRRRLINTRIDNSMFMENKRVCDWLGLLGLPNARNGLFCYTVATRGLKGAGPSWNNEETTRFCMAQDW